MNTLCLNSRDELAIINLSKIAYVKADGNYCSITYISGQTQALTISISKFEEALRLAKEPERAARFIRLGRSLIINSGYLYGISVLRQRILLSDFDGHVFTLAVPKLVLKKFKTMVAETTGRKGSIAPQ